MAPRDLILATALAASLAFAQESGIPPRDSSLGYQAHTEASGATIAASVVSLAQAAKLFTGEVARKYIVVEVAVYPAPGHEMNIHLLDFALNREGGKSRPANPEEVAAVWGQPRASLPLRPPAMGAANIANSPPRYGDGPDSQSLAQKLRRFALPMGRISHPLAGYLYFPIPKRQSHEATELEYLPAVGASIHLSFH